MYLRRILNWALVFFHRS